jgi:hypothetical protein
VLQRLLGFVLRQRQVLGAGAAVTAGILFFLSLRAINSAAETEFLYFQF